MGWDDSDDDEWDKADLTLDAGGASSSAAAEKEQWSDEETEEDRAAAKAKEAADKVKGTAHVKEKERELTKLEIAIAEREAREIKEAAEEKARKKALLAARMAGEAQSELEQELMDGGAGGDIDDDFEWDGGRGHFEPEIDTTGLASQEKKEVPAFVPKTDADFEKMAAQIHEMIKQYEGRRGHLTLLKALYKEAMVNMGTDEAKQLATLMSTIFNAKVAAEREKDKGKKKATKKGQMTQGKATGADVGGRAGFDDYDDDY